MPEREIQIVLNGKPRRIRENSSVADLLSDLDIRHGALAVEVNAQVLTRQSYGQAVLADGDRVEIVSLVGGG